MSSQKDLVMDQYFNGFVPMLENLVRGSGCGIDDDDPTIDLGRMEVCRRPSLPSAKDKQHQQQSQQHQHHPHHHHNQQQQQKRRSGGSTSNQAATNRTFERAVANNDNNNNNRNNGDNDKGESCSLDELYVITEHLKKKSSYGDKLIAIMLDGLEKSLSPYFYRGILEFGPPAEWLPIVKRNTEDTPYVEFLIKNVKSDEEPFSQMTDYSLEHLALSKYVMDHMLSYARHSNQQNKPPSSRQIEQATAQRTIKSAEASQSVQPNRLSTKQEASTRQRILPCEKNKRASMPTMTCSTPIRQRQAAIAPKRVSTIPVQRSLTDTLNDSKRILPPRACKINPLDETYRK